MSYRIVDIMAEYTDRQTGARAIMCEIAADTAADLPANTADLQYILGSFAKTIDTGDLYKINSFGSWILQPSDNQFANVYTKAETDAIINRIDSDIADVENDISDLHDSLAGILDSGSKNKMPVASGQSTPPTRWINVPVVLPPGTYRISFGSLVSTDTDDQVCQACFLSGSLQVSNWLSFERGTNVHSGICTITAETTVFRLYPAGSYASSEGDTVTFDQCMICTEDDWKISETYVPYCPSLYDLYLLVKSYHP